MNKENTSKQVQKNIAKNQRKLLKKNVQKTNAMITIQNNEKFVKASEKYTK